jgi:hypothetical protein
MKTFVLLCVLSMLGGGLAWADDQAQPNAVYALIVGANRSVDADLKPLRYADDDAVRYQELFRALGARTLLLATLDEETSRLSPQAAAEAQPPTHAFLSKAVAQFATEIATARARAVKTTFYFLYAGHGSIDGDQAYVTLEDARLDAASLGHEILDVIKADENHLIVDACYSYFLVGERGPGGERRPMQGFSALSDLGRRSNLGLLLSTSSGTESHEWGAYQAGIFSHEVRSGLYGAADFDGDGRISYLEMAAFLGRANQAIANDRYRPQVFARAPTGTTQLIDLRPGLGRSLAVGEGFPSAHYLVEDSRGVRVMDFHNAQGRAFNLVRPGGAGNLFLRRLSDGQEVTVPASSQKVELALLAFTDPRIAQRGAAHQAFSLIFSLPFDEAREGLVLTAPPPVRPATPSRRKWVLGAVGAGTVISAAVGGALLWDASSKADEAHRSSGRRAAYLNGRINGRNTQSLVAFSLAGAGLTAGAILWFFYRPTMDPPSMDRGDIQVGLGPSQITMSGRF